MSETFRIAALAREYGITTRTIRFYEDKGLLAPVREGSQRVYSARDFVRLRLIMRGKRLGFSLGEIRQLIDLYDVDPTEKTQLEFFIKKIHERQNQLKQQKQDITETLSELNRLEKQCMVILNNNGVIE